MPYSPFVTIFYLFLYNSLSHTTVWGKVHIHMYIYIGMHIYTFLYMHVYLTTNCDLYERYLNI